MTEADRIFSKFPDFIKEFIYRNNWTELRDIQLDAARVIFDTDANLIFLAISGVFVAIVAQMGDIIMSLIKREYGIKDYGKLFPGHGGVLDRFDSILAVSLMLAIICVFAGIINISLI